MRIVLGQRGFLVLAAACIVAGGCGAATLGPDGGGGSGGTDAAADHGTGTGGTTGVGGTTGTGGSTGGAAGTGGASGAGGAGGAGGSGVPACTSTTSTSPAMSAADFCAIFIDACSGVTGFTVPPEYSTPAMCVTSYSDLTDSQRTCRSYHVCNAVTTGLKTTHCPHAVGVTLCQQ